MTGDDLAGWLVADEPRIRAAIEIGAQWEIWMQVELAIVLKARGLQAAREVPYIPPSGRTSLDCLAADQTRHYAIELKVESATNAGRLVLKNLLEDVEKLKAWNDGRNPATLRWAVGIAYSAEAKQAFRDQAPKSKAALKEGGAIVVIVIPV